ncbi:MAG: hypothetical protein H6654_09200 [Ardenticatenaceae bacterium]|nr:hypothetical protein [Anaerolineales bacterium]MCB8938589.1 hypothetical protein [Ardenticatenaceae bacterium]MCB8973722.1 hypothetical protein [Ardenticatenaceae bacterium]
MAQTNTLNAEPPHRLRALPQEMDHETLPSFRRLGLVYGVLIGLAIAVGFWLPKMLVMSRLPVWFPYGGAILSGLAVLLLGGVAGWLSSAVHRPLFAFLVWLATAVLICVGLGTLPPIGQNWAVWLADARFSGLDITPAPDHLFWWSYVIAGFLLISLLPLMAILQNSNLVSAHQELVYGRRLNRQVVFRLLLPALLAGFLGSLFPDLTTSAPRNALIITDQAIQRVRDYDGELFQLSLDTGFNYNALDSVREQLDGPYTLLVNEVVDEWSSAVITAHFESGAWVNCRVNITQEDATYFSFCFDAGIPFTDGMNHLLYNNVPADSCRRCEVNADATWQTWLQERASLFASEPVWQRVAQYGRFILIEATTSQNSRISCQLEGSEVIQLVSCEEMEIGD